MRLNNDIHNAVFYILLDVAFASRYIVIREETWGPEKCLRSPPTRSWPA